ncbi:MAG: SDR family NAD(P)-dependent oxidoreductase [Alphaproteobacteria bacterium]|nr:SDR family NAD(P)-dependent oxidoreductase [Alphaproteobacteria bacterium]
MTVLVTGAAGFIGFHVAQRFLAEGRSVVGVDNLNDYYDVGLKEARVAVLTQHRPFRFVRANIADRDAMTALAGQIPETTEIVHLAAQAGVRHSLANPYVYVESNVMGQVVMLELYRLLPKARHFVYASSSSVYGNSDKIPFSIDDRADTPISLYAATKRADELIAHTYAHLYHIPATGLRFFTVYGPWGRPDMAAFIFTKAILTGEPIQLFNAGAMERDFTYIDDIVTGVVNATRRVPDGSPPHSLYNLGNNQPEKLGDFVAAIEVAAGRKATVIPAPMQPGDVTRTFADIEASRRDLGYSPSTPISEGVPRFVRWYRQHYCL